MSALVTQPVAPTSGPDVVTRVNPLLDGDAWDRGLGVFPAATFFHTAAWARVLHETYGQQPVYFRSEAPDGSRSLLPLVEVNSWLTGRRGVSLPFTDECAPCYSDDESFRRLFDEVISHARSRSWRYIECRGKRALFRQSAAAISYHGHVLTLDGNDRAVFDRFESSVRRAIRKAERSHLRIEIASTLEATRNFYRLLCQTRRRHGVPPQPFRFFAAIQRRVLATGKGFIVLARFGGRPIAGAIYFHFAKNAIFKFGASDPAFQHLRANNLVMWEAIKWFNNGGFHSLHLGRTAMENPGLRRFKLSWGASEGTIDHIKYDLRMGNFVTGQPPLPRWHRHIFRALPAPASRMVGALLYRHIA